MKKLPLLLTLPILALLLAGMTVAPSKEASTETFLVKRVVDGDTIKLANGETVRYIGIDTPETKHPKKPVQYFGKEAAAANKKLVAGQKVRLEYDVQPRDKYGRLLAYVYVDDIFVNAWLVENGYAQVMTIPPNVKYQELFLKLQKGAREAGRGLWRKP